MIADDLPVVEEEQASTKESVAAGVPSQEGMVELRGNDIALEMDGLRLSRDELLVLLQHLNAIPSQEESFAALQERTNGLTVAQQRAFRGMLYQLVRQQLVLRAAHDENVTVTEEDRRHIAILWNEQNPGHDLAEYLGQFPQTATDPLSLSRDDMFLLFKWTEQQLAQVEVPEEAVQYVQSQIQQVYDTFGHQVEEDRKAFAALADNPELYTDDGFAKLAQEISEGTEADKGGVIKELLTRSEIAAANFDQPFATPVGETSELIETPTSLRYIRVLEEIPGEMPGEPPKLRIAQILYAKKALDDLPTEEQIRVDLKYQFEEKFISELLLTLAERFHFQCRIIPDLLDLDKIKQPAEQSVDESTEESEEEGGMEPSL